MGSPSAKTKSSEEQRFQRSALIINAVSSNVSLAIKCALLAFIAFEITVVLAAFAGKFTHADIVLKGLENINFQQLASGVLGMGGMGWGVAERRLRKRSLKGKDTELAKLTEDLTRMLESRR